MTDETTTTPKRPSLVMLLMGLICLALSITALLGPSTWGAAPAIPIGWIAVAVAIVIGLGLIVSPGRRRRRR